MMKSLSDQLISPQSRGYQTMDEPPPPYVTHSDAVVMNSSDKRAFPKSAGCRDLWAALLFAVQFAAFVGLAALGSQTMIQQLRSENPFGLNPERGHYPDELNVSSHTNAAKTATKTNAVANVHDHPTIWLNAYTRAMVMRTVPAMLAIVFIFAGLCLWLAYKHTKCFIIATYWINVVVFTGASVIAFLGGEIGASILMVLAATGCVLMFLFIRHRIDFSVIMLQSVMWVIFKYPATVVVAIIALTTQILLSFWWIFSVVGLVFLYTSQDDTASVVGISVFMIFSFYWTFQVIKNLGHTTNCGVFASFYFYGETSGEAFNQQPTIYAAKRAFSQSFGSVCLGSLIVAIIQTIRFLCGAKSERNRATSAAGAVSGCILGCIEQLTKYFNHYAYTVVAIYGKSFVQAAKDIWEIFKSRGFNLIINDLLIANVVNFVVLFTSVTSGVATWIVATKGGVAIPADDETRVDVILAVLCAVFAAVLMSVFLDIVESGCATVFVCLAKDPEALRRTRPELFAKFLSSYPAISVTDEPKVMN